MSEFSIAEMEKYVNERVEENCSDSLEDFAAACIEYRIKSLGNVNISITKTEISELIALDEESTTVIVEKITEKYGIDIDMLLQKIRIKKYNVKKSKINLKLTH